MRDILRDEDATMYLRRKRERRTVWVHETIHSQAAWRIADALLSSLQLVVAVPSRFKFA